MELVAFLYNSLLVIIYAVAAVLSFIYYQQKKQFLFLAVALFFALCILDETVVSMTEFIHWFSAYYNTLFITVPAFKTFILFCKTLLYLVIFLQLTKQSFRLTHGLILVGYALWLLFVPILSNEVWKVWLYYLPTQLVLIFLSSSWLVKHRKKYFRQPLLRKIAWITLILAFSIIIEDSFVIFHLDQYSTARVMIHNRNLSEDCLTLFYAGLTIMLLFKQFARDYQIKQLNKETSAGVHYSNEELFQRFCAQYQITKREQDILRLLLESKNNQEIADTLYISVGTVKTHIHNIFQKLAVTKRNQIFIAYHRYSENMLHSD